MDEMNNVNTNEIVEGTEEITEALDESDNVNLIALGIGAVVGVVGGIAALIYKNRNKLEAMRVERLRKKGYIIYEPETTDDCDEESSDTLKIIK